MDNAAYTSLTRQSGLVNELQVIANNIANSATSGFRKEGVIFSEFIQSSGVGPSLSMAAANARQTSFEQGTLTQTGSQLDVAIEGDGFFMIQTPAGERLTRAGSFSLNNAGELVTLDGYQVMDAGGAPIFIPPDASVVSIGGDGTISGDGQLIGQLGLFRPTDPTTLKREDGVRFSTEGGTEPDDTSSVAQGFVESSNVNPVVEMARLIQVQRAYELGQSFLESEDERVQTAIQTFIKRG